MAAKVEFTEKLWPALQRTKTDCLSEILTGNGIKKVNDFFKELDDAVGVLEHKYSQCSRDSNIQRLLPFRRMVARALRKVHSKIIRRLSSRPKLANPWLGEFTVDMPMEVFECISKDILDWTNFGHEFSETNTQMFYKIIDFRKAKRLFTRMDIDGAEVDQENILKKSHSIVKWRGVRWLFWMRSHWSWSFIRKTKFWPWNFTMATGTWTVYHSPRSS